jgi:hypothetical protein
MRALFLGLLVLSASADDGLARLTPSADDDLVAAEDNDFPPAARPAAAGVRAELQSPAPAPGPGAGETPPALSPFNPPRAAPPAPGASRVYALKSLRL